MAKSWFELTLWHGTPKELTTTQELKVVFSDTAVTHIPKSNSGEVFIDLDTPLKTRIPASSGIEANINILSEVIVSVKANGG